MGLGSIPGRFPGRGGAITPRFKNFMAGGPIIIFFCGAAIGGTSLENMDHHQCSSVEELLLICLHADDWREADAARKIFQAML